MQCIINSKISVNKQYTMEPCPADTPEKLPSMILWTLCLVLKCIYICLWTIKTPEMRKPLAATVQKLCKTLVYRFCKIVHYFQWIQRPVIISILLVIMLTILSLHCTAIERSKNAASLCSTAVARFPFPVHAVG